MSTAEKAAYLERQGLPPDATWDVYEEMMLKNDVVYSINFWLSKEHDSYTISDYISPICSINF